MGEPLGDQAYAGGVLRPAEFGTGGPGLLRIFHRLSDTPAEIVTELGETLVYTAIPGSVSHDRLQLLSAVAPWPS